ncbi:hypothetical protein CBS101457_001085 [Exobasidium rhododendri]|nr:hypothetical protein CBS101457_001085 [Exobasidium rhododendri]
MSLQPQFVQQLHQLLQQSNVPDTEAVRAATDALQNTFYKNPNCVPALFEITSTSPDLAVRQLASVELRKRLAKSGGKAWTKQAAQVREGIKARLLESVINEQSTLVRNALARVIAEIAKKELPSGTWSQLLPFLFQASNSPTAAHRQVSILVFFIVLETFVDGQESLERYLPQIMQVFSKSLQDPESLEVRVTTVRALGKVAENLDVDSTTDLALVQSAIPLMVQVLDQTLKESDAEGIRHCLDVFESICMLETPIISNHIPDLIQFFLANGANKELEDDHRVMCYNSLIWISQYKKSKIQSLGLARPMLERLMPVVVEEDPEDPDEDSPSRLALRVIDGLATELPPSHVFPPLLEQMQAYMANPEPHHRKAAMMAFAVSVEGCSEYIRPHMEELWPFVEGGLRDPDLVVRKAACITVGCLCESLDAECAARHATLLPLIMDLINNNDTQKNACTALDSLLEVIGEDIAQYLPAIMERLSNLLETAPLPVKATVTGAIGSAAHASKEAFLPYFTQTMQRMQPNLLLKEEGDETDLRGVTMDTVGTFAEAVGKEQFRPYFSDLMNLAYEGVNLDNPRLRECSFIFFSVMCRVFGEEFSQFLPAVVPKLLESFRQSEHAPVPGAVGGDGVLNGLGVSTNDQDDNDDDFIDLDEVFENLQNVNTAVGVEKAVAADALGEIFVYTREGFTPFLASSVEELINLLDHYYQGIRKSAIGALLVFINTLNDMSSPAEWQPGHSASPPLNSDVAKLVEAVIPAIMDSWADEDDQMTQIEICQQLAECLNKNGPRILTSEADRTCSYVVDILDQKSACQIDTEAAEAEEANVEDISEYESVLISAATDLVGAMANVYGADFIEPLKQLLPKITKYYSPSRSTSDRATAIGSLGEIITGMKAAITPFTTEILSILSRALQDEDVSIRSNAAFASGVLIENSQTNLSEHFNALLGAIRPMFDITSTKDEALTARDNACGCLCRMITKNQSAVPLDQALPVLLGALPLKKDMVEWSPVLKTLMGLLQANEPNAIANIDTILQIMAAALQLDGDDALGGVMRGQVVAFISAINASAPEKINAAGLQTYLV